MPRIVTLAVLLALIITLGTTFFRVVAPFLLPLFLAVMTAIVCQPVYHYFLKRTKNRAGWAAGLTVASILSALLVPLLVGGLIASLQLYTFAQTVGDSREWQKIFPRTEQAAPVEEATAPQQSAPDNEGQQSALDETATDGTAAPPADSAEASDSPVEPPEPASEQSAGAAVGAQQAEVPPVAQPTYFEKAVEVANRYLPRDQRRTPDQVAEELRENVRKAMIELGNRSLGLAGTTVGILAATAATIAAGILATAIYAIALFYFLSDGPALLEGVERLIPVHAEYKRDLMREFAKVVRSVVVATFFAAIAQGVATTLALWFFGFPHTFMLLVLSTFAALIPLVGTPIVWGPCVIILGVTGHPIQAVLLFLWGAGAVGFLDNVIRAYVLNTDTKLHPLLAFVSVIGGLQVLGLWGVFIGPIVASCLHALVKIFNHELMLLSRERFAAAKLAEASSGSGGSSGAAGRGRFGTESMTAEMLRQIAQESGPLPEKPSKPDSAAKNT